MPISTAFFVAPVTRRRKPSTWSTSCRQSSYSHAKEKSRLGILLCLLALTLQLTLPAVHMWDVTAVPASRAEAGASTWQLHYSPSHLPAMATSAQDAQAPLHDADSCPSCQFLRYGRDWNTSQIETIDVSPQVSRYFLTQTFRTAQRHRTMSIPRAPPSLS